MLVNLNGRLVNVEGGQGNNRSGENGMWDQAVSPATKETSSDRDPNRKSSDKFGFEQQTHDFQLLVLEDEHTDSVGLDSPTAYYFWAEIE